VQQHWKGIGSYGTVGLEFGLSVVFGLLIGRWLDSKFDSGGWLTALWFGFGLAAGSRAVYRAIQRANREADEIDRREREARKKYLDDQD
jgi:ATP synthase protein I